MATTEGTVGLGELRWFIGDYLPRHLELLLNLLGACRSACNGAGFERPSSATPPSPATPVAEGPNRSIIFPSATLVLSTVGTDVLKGFVTLDGHRIGRAEVQLNFPTWNKGHPMSIHLDPEHPVDIPQIIICSNLVDLAISAIRRGQSEAFPPSILSHFGEALGHCERAVRILENPLNEHVPTRARLVGAPEDLTLSFGVQNCRIVAIIQSIQSASQSSLATGTSSASSLRVSSRASFMAGSGFAPPPSPEVLVQVDSMVPALTAARELLQRSLEALTRLHRQLSDLL